MSNVRTQEDKSAPRSTFPLLAFVVCVYTVLQTSVAPILRMLAQEYDTTLTIASWTLTANLIAAAVLAPIVGRVGDAMGRSRTMIVVLMLAAAGCAVSATAPNIWLVILGRLIQAAGAGIVPLAFGIVHEVFPARRVGGVVGRLSAVLGVGSAAGYVVTGPVVDALGPRWVFWLPAVAFLFGIAWAYLVVPTSGSRDGDLFRWSTAALLSLALAAGLLAVTAIPAEGWLSARVVVLTIVAIAIGILWFRAEHKDEAPLIDVRLFRERVIWASSLVTLLLGAGLYAILSFMPPMLQAPRSSGYGLSMTITQSGLAMVPLALAFLAAGTTFGFAERRIAPHRLLTVGTFLAGGSMSAMTVMHETTLQVLVLLALLGLGVGLAFAALSAIIVRSVPRTQTSAASAINVNLRLIGGALGVAIAGSVLAGRPGPGSGEHTSEALPTEAAYVLMFAILGGIVLVACGCSLGARARGSTACQSCG